MAQGGEWCFAGADEGGFPAVGIGSDDLEAGGGSEAFVAGAGRQYDDIAERDVEFPALIPTEQKGGIATRNAEDLVAVRMEMMIVIDAPPPTRTLTVRGKLGLEPSGGICRLGGRRAAHQDNRKVRMIGSFAVVGEATRLDGSGGSGHGACSRIFGTLQ